MTYAHIPTERLERIRAISYDYSSKPKTRITTCNLCGAAEQTLITHVDRYGYSATAASCSRCGLTFLNPMMDGGAYGEFYACVYRPLVSAYHGRLIDAQSIQAEQVEYATALAALLRPWMAERRVKTMLDIGGSTGVVAVELAKTFELRAAVLDPAADELDWAAKFGTETITGFLEDYDPQGRRFDLVILCQTIDHLTDAMGSLRKIREVLAPGGLFFVDIVDFRAAYLRNASVEGAIKIDHPYYFTEDTIEAMLARAGFQVLQQNYAGDHLHVGYVCSTGEPRPDALPEAVAVREFFREVRFVQNARR